MSTLLKPDVRLYPDSGKFGVYAGAAPGGTKEVRTFVYSGFQKDATPYWDGE